MRVSRKYRLSALTLALVFTPALSPLSTRAVAAAPDVSETRGSTDFAYADVWSQSSKLVREGKVDQARAQLEELASRSKDPARARVWINKWLDEENKRAELTAEEYEDYVGRAHKWMEKEDYTRALKWTYWAQLDKFKDDSFQQLDWVQKLRDLSLAKADQLRKEANWRDAHALYYSLSLIFEDDKSIDKKRKECLEHARLEEIYKKDRDWQEDLEGISERMVEEAFYRIDRKYVEEADFKAMTEAGFDELLLIAESPTLREQFDGLTGDRGKDFVAGIQQRLDQVKAQKSLTYREALQYFRRALQINQETAKVPEELLVREYTNASLEPLDEFTSVIWPSEYREFEKHTRGDFIGVGIQIRNKYNPAPEVKDTEIVVVSPLEDTPAYRAGIQAEDVITKVNGESMIGVPVTKAVAKITGPMHTSVTLTIRRTGEDGEEKSFEVPLVRDMVRIQSVKSLARKTSDEEHWNFILDDDLGIGYIRVNSFQENTVAQLDEALRDAAKRGMRGLILDLRYNPGGLLKSAVEMAELFLPPHARVVSTRGLRSEEWPVDSESDGPYSDLPLLVLINEGSASASEIVSGAIQDHHRGLLIGDRSFGKFSVQNLIRLVHSEAHLKLTTARYYLPSGRSLHREDATGEWGIAPDIAVPLVPKEESKIIFMRRDADVIGAVKTKSEEELDEPMKPVEEDKTTADKEKPEEEEEAPDPNNRPDRDPQLATALLVMRLHLLAEDPVRMATRDDQVTQTPVTNE
ncbi:MAG TPA: S41 family peptidase [Phycisphaerae bacterium]|nr:PDZ domain-containing protein [Phycisphaerales bacterium]HRX83946.1 S41 family peptidase [Phycisphaerae bacterium]